MSLWPRQGSLSPTSAYPYLVLWIGGVVEEGLPISPNHQSKPPTEASLTTAQHGTKKRTTKCTVLGTESPSGNWTFFGNWTRFLLLTPRGTTSSCLTTSQEHFPDKAGRPTPGKGNKYCRSPNLQSIKLSKQKRKGS